MPRVVYALLLVLALHTGLTESRGRAAALVGAMPTGIAAALRAPDASPAWSRVAHSAGRDDSGVFDRRSRWLAVAGGLRGGGSKGGAPLPVKPVSIKGMLTATRPWSWTAGIIPVLLTGALLHKADGVSVEKSGLINALTMVITLQASGNLVNSYIDYYYGVDTIDTAGDRTIVDAHVCPVVALALAGVLLVAAFLAVVPTMVGLRATGAARELELTFWVGVGMVFSYTCWPFRLKYRGLGDITVFLLFGPMLMQVAAMLISGSVQHWVLPYGIPAALLTEAILHANNMRDIAQDRNAGISTLATVVGFRVSQVLYWALILSAYGVAGALAVVRFKGCALAMLTLPLAVSALKDCKPETLRNLDESTAKMHLLFGVLMTAGTLLI